MFFPLQFRNRIRRMFRKCSCCSRGSNGDKKPKSNVDSVIDKSRHQLYAQTTMAPNGQTGTNLVAVNQNGHILNNHAANVQLMEQSLAPHSHSSSSGGSSSTTSSTGTSSGSSLDQSKVGINNNSNVCPCPQPDCQQLCFAGSPKHQYNQMLQSTYHFQTTPSTPVHSHRDSAFSQLPVASPISMSQPASVRATPTNNVYDLYGHQEQHATYQPLSVQPLMVINTPLPSASSVYGHPSRTDSFTQATQPDNPQILNNSIHVSNRYLASNPLFRPTRAPEGVVPMIPLSRLSRSTPASPTTDLSNTTVYYNQIHKNQEPSLMVTHSDFPNRRYQSSNPNRHITQSPNLTKVKSNHGRSGSCSSILSSHGLRGPTDLEDQRPKSHSPSTMQPYYNLRQQPLTPSMGVLSQQHNHITSQILNEKFHGRQSSSSAGF